MLETKPIPTLEMKVAPSPQESIQQWAAIRFQTLVSGQLDRARATDLLRTLSSETQQLQALQIEKNVFTEDLFFDNLPDSAEAFTLYNPQLGRTRLIPSFNDQISQRISRIVGNHLSEFLTDHNPLHLEQIRSVTDFAIQARQLYTEFTSAHSSDITLLRDRLKYLGLDKNLITQGENSELITTLVKSAGFGRLTPEDRGRTDRPTVKNVITTGETPKLTPITTPTTDDIGSELPSTHDEQLLSMVKSLTADPGLARLHNEYSNNAEITDLVDWTARQAIVRQLLPREAKVPVRNIDMTKLQRIKSLTAEASSEPFFQASNPLSLWQDPETGRKFIVKHCPEQTLQSDYFGLEMLQLSGVPIYEFYTGFIPEKDGQPATRVLVTGFLEGFEDPSHLINLPAGTQAEMIKARLPEYLQTNRAIQQGLLMEILIGEYNSKAHNFMVLGQSVQHLDQGACLTSTATGKFKGLGETVTIEDIQDIIHCYPDWDWNAQEPVNEAYARVATVDNGKLVIHDVDTAKRLLHQLQSIPQEKIDEALERAGFEDGPKSVERMQAWITKINTELLPKYQKKAGEEQVRDGKISARSAQYIRWANSAIATFEKAISMGGELSYYKHTLRTRRASLQSLWQQAISEVEAAKVEKTKVR